MKTGGGDILIFPEKERLNIKLIEHLQLDTPQVEPIKDLLEKGANPNITHKFVNSYSTITNVILTKDGKAIFKLLLEHGLDPNLKDNNSKGDTLLHFVIRHKQLGLVKLLIEHHALVNLTNNDNETPLFISVRLHLDDIVSDLLTVGADPNLADKLNRTPLHFASHDGALNLVQLLLMHDGKPDVRDTMNYSPLVYAIVGNNEHVIEELITVSNKFTIKDALLFIFFNRFNLLNPNSNKLDMIKLIVENYAFDSVYDDEELLYEIVRTLVDIYLESFKEQDLQIINWLISYIGKQPFFTIIERQPYILTELMYIYSIDVKHLEFLLNSGISADTIHPYSGDTSLITSAKNNYTNLEVVKCLVSYSKDKVKLINTENKEGETPLMLFVNFADNIIKFLIDNGGDINYRNKFEETFFMHACKSSFDINYLIKKGADIDNQDENGETALMWAIKDENEENVKILLENKADIISYNKNAYETAIDVNNSTILRLLSEYILENRIDIGSKYDKLIRKYTSNNRFKWTDACNRNDRPEIQQYKDILHIDNIDENNICNKLDNYEDTLNKFKQESLNKCINNDNLDGNDIQNIYPENFYVYKDNGVTYCEDVRTLFKLIKSYKKRKPPKKVENPYTGKPFDEFIIKDIEDKYQLYNIISTGKQIDDISTPITPSSKDILLGQISLLYNIMKNLTVKNLFIDASVVQVDNFVNLLEELPIPISLSQETTTTTPSSTNIEFGLDISGNDRFRQMSFRPIFKKSELDNLKHDDLDKYKYQLVQLILSKILHDKYKYMEGDSIIYPTREAIQNMWNKVFV